MTGEWIPLEQKDAVHARNVRTWIEGGCSSWGVPEQSITYLADRVDALKLEVNQAAGATVYEVDKRKG